MEHTPIRHHLGVQMKKVSRTYTEEQFREAVKNSTSIRQVLLALGLNPKGGGRLSLITKHIKRI